MAFSESTVIITGASRGIGRQLALTFARDTDHALFLIARDKIALEKVKEECTEAGCGKIHIESCDITDSAAIDTIGYPDELPEPGILVNNAGSFIIKPLADTTPDEFEGQWSTNTLGAFLLTRKFLPMIRRQERGLIVNISSISALKGQSRSGAYSSSKHALQGFSRSLRLELRKTKVAVTTINLGQTMSTSWEGIDVDPDELIDPADIGALIVTLSCLSPRTVAEEIILRPQRGDRSPD